jgi:hypothetical protein
MLSLLYIKHLKTFVLKLFLYLLALKKNTIDKKYEILDCQLKR